MAVSSHLSEAEFLTLLGQRLKQLRQQRGISLTTLAEQAAVTSSFLSQLERGKKPCSLMTLHRITEVLHVAVGDLFTSLQTQTDGEEKVVVRRGGRLPIVLPGLRQRLYLLAPHKTLSLEPLLNVLPPGVATADHPVSHQGEEWFYVLRGEVELTLDGTRYLLTAGDAAGFASSRPHRVLNHGAEEAELIWVNMPGQF